MLNENPNTPEAIASPDLGKEIEKLKADLESSRRDATTKITELAQSKATLEKRLSELGRVDEGQRRAVATTESQNRIAAILDKAKLDPGAAAVELHQILEETKNSTVQGLLPKFDNAVKSVLHIERLKDKNPELIPHEELIFAKVKLLMEKDSSKQFTQALDEVVDEVKNIMSINKQVNQPTQTPQPAPVIPVIPVAGRGESGGNPPPPAAPKADDKILSPDEIARNEILAMNKRLSNKILHK